MGASCSAEGKLYQRGLFKSSMIGQSSYQCWMEGFLASTLSLFGFGSIRHGLSPSRMETTGLEKSVYTEIDTSIGEGAPPFSVMYWMILITSLRCKRGVFQRTRR